MNQTKRRLSDDFVNRLKENKDTLILPNSSWLPPQIIDEIIDELIKTLNLEQRRDAFTIIAIFAQQGATAQSASGNMTFDYLGKTYKLADIRRAFANKNAKGALRKFARTKGSLFFEICKELNIEGNMYNKVRRLNPNSELSNDDKYWLSDYQAFNEDAPLYLRKYLINAFPKRRKDEKTQT